MECPNCRTPIHSEGRNCTIDSTIDAMIGSLSEEAQRHRKELVQQRQELMNSMLRAPVPAPTTHERGRGFVAARRAVRTSGSRRQDPPQRQGK